MKRYNKYKDSGIAWLGQIPEHWEVRKLREIIEIYSDKGYPNATLLSVVRERGVVVRDIESKEENHNYIPSDLSGYKRVKRGDFVINKMKAWQGSYGVSDYEGIVSPAYYTCKLRCANKSFFHIAVRSATYVPFFTQYSKGIRVGQWDLSPVDLKSIPFIAPPIPEQAAIVSYLDRKVSELDSFVSKQETQISYLKELKQATIAKAVTRGIAPSVALKDSGIPWLGQIPEHWEMRIGKRIYSANDGGVWGDDPDGDNDTIVLRSTEQTEDGNLQVINPAKRKLSPRERISGMLLEGDLIITKSSGSPSHIGKTSLIDKSTELLGCCYSNFIQRVRVKGSPRFYWYVFNSQFVRGQFQNLSTTTTGLGNLSGSMINNILLPLPPMPEQVAIVSYLDEKLGAIDRLIAASEAAIARVRELKQTLIADVVTGRICVQPS